MQSDQETKWILASQKGDVKAFGLLASKYQDTIYTLCRRMLKNNADAQDLCQDILIKMFKNISQYQNHSPFGAWVYRIGYNESINKLRKLKRSSEHMEALVNEREHWVETSNALKTLEKIEKKKVLIDAIHQLQESDRFLIMAYYFEELPIKEISAIIDLTESNIKIKLHRSRKQLHGILSASSIKENLI